MTTGSRSHFGESIRATLLGARIPVILGLCGTGRTTLLRDIRADLAPGTCQYVNVERTATTPERFLRALTASSPFAEGREAPPAGSPRTAFDAVLAFLAGARCPDGSPATFLLDEVMEFRTFESFPGLRRALPEVLAAISSTPNRFVLTSRYMTRAARALADAAPHMLVAPMQALSVDEVESMLAGPSPVHPSDLSDDANQGAAPNGSEQVAPPAGLDPDSGAGPQSRCAAVILALTGGRPSYAHALLHTMAESAGAARIDPMAALALALEPRGRLSVLCGHSYELRLHRARGYGALKAILEILSEEEPLTLTEISQRLGRTPGSTKDYLSWLDDVDLVSATRKRYRFRDPLIRSWCRLHCRTDDPTPEEIRREVATYAEGCAITVQR